MNYNLEDLINALLAEMPEEKAAEELTLALNNAIEAKKAKEEEKMAREKRTKDFRALLKTSLNFINTYYPAISADFADFDIETVPTEDLDEILDTLDEELNELQVMLKVITPAPNKKTQETKLKLTPEEIFADFFRKNNI